VNVEDRSGDYLEGDIFKAVEALYRAVCADVKATSQKLEEEGYEILEWHNSDEVVVENIQSNEYTFLASGKREDA
jgi:hypothetical protein